MPLLSKGRVTGRIVNRRHAGIQSATAIPGSRFLPMTQESKMLPLQFQSPIRISLDSEHTGHDDSPLRARFNFNHR